jgi:hypothetical protein
MASADPPLAAAGYEAAVRAVATALTPEDLENAVDEYLLAGAGVQREVAGDGARFSALIAGDLRLLSHLEQLDQPDNRQSVAPSGVDRAMLAGGFTSDMGLVLEGLGGAAPPPGPEDIAPVAPADQTPIEMATTAIDAIIGEGSQVAGKIIPAFPLPMGDQILAIMQAVGAQTGAQLAHAAIDAAGWLASKIGAAIAKLLGALIDRVTSWVEASATASSLLARAEGWLDKTLADPNPLGLLLGAAALKAAVDQDLNIDPSTAPARGQLAADLVAPHAHSQRWIRWGATGLAVADALQVAKVLPWGFALAVSAGALLLAVSVWTVNDYLDARDWPLRRVVGVRTVVIPASSP